MSKQAGFYRVYKTDRAATLDEAIEIARDEAVAKGFDGATLEVNRQQTGVSDDGYFVVGLLGRTLTSLAREKKRETARVKS